MVDRAGPAAGADAGTDEAALLSRAEGGDAGAYAVLVRRYHRRVRAYLSSVVRDVDAADDLAQEVFLTAFRSLATRQAGAPFALWLLGIARNRARWYLRDERTRARRADPFERVLAQWRERADDDTPLGPRERALVALETCLAALPAPSAALVSDHYYRRRALADVARELGRKESAVRMTLMRIRAALRECVARRLSEDTP